uniref:Putative 39s ribosomal protein l39 n=1 Tax=Rhipicephalus pulchellus TaxID=72859 RepID=L7LWJ4_RHIPC
MSLNSANRVIFLLRGVCSRHRSFCSSSVATNESRLTNEAVRKKRDALFTAEKERQAALITRVEKIEVRYLGPMEDCTLIMNKGISTPHDCARHIHESLVQRAAIAEVDGEPWDMSRPLVQDCQLRLNFYKDPNPYFANKAFWRTGSFLLGYIVDRAFKDQFYVQLHSWPQPQVRSGSFVYNVDLGIENWEPRRDEMDVLSGMGRRLATKPHHFERLEVDASLALRMFEDNKYKAEQIPRIAAASPTGNTVTLYRLLDHVDISSGPMIGSLDHMSRFKVVAVYPMDTSIGLLYRFQGLAIPSSFSISEFAYNVCCERAQRMNYTGLPKTESEADEEPSEENVHFEDVSAEDEHVESKITSDNVAAAPKDSVPAGSNRTSSS